METSIKEYIINNFKEDNIEEINKAIDESIGSQDEVTLPGLGVFLTLIWENANDELKQQLLKIIHENIKNSYSN